MLSRRIRVLVALFVCTACGFAAFAAISSHSADGEPSTAVTGSPIAATSTGADAQVEGPEPSAFARLPRAMDTPLAEVPHLGEDVRRIATVRAFDADHALYVGKMKSRDMTCLILQEGALGRGGGGCNPSRNPFQGSDVMWSSTAYNEDPQKMVVFGVVTERVGSVSLTFGGGVQKAVPLSQDDGFIYVVSKPVIEPSDVPKAIITFDAQGRPLEQIQLGITFAP